MPKILIIDDEEQIRKMLRAFLEGEDFHIFEAKNGNEGIKIFKDEMPEIVISDIIMPDKEGLETIMEINRMGMNTKIIAISGGGYVHSTSYLDLALKLGADFVLEKPFERVALMETINLALNQGNK